MQDPTELFRYEVDTDLETPAPGTLIVAIDGFMDAGGAQRLLVHHLLESAEDATVVASFDVDALIDYRGRRPAMTFEATAWTAYDDPSLCSTACRTATARATTCSRVPSRTTSGSAWSRRPVAHRARSASA